MTVAHTCDDGWHPRARKMRTTRDRTSSSSPGRSSIFRSHSSRAPTASPSGFYPDGSIYLAAGRSTEPLAEERGNAIFPKSQLTEGTDYTVVRWNGVEQRCSEVRDEALITSYVQPTPRGFLLVGARCRWRPEGAETNAVEYDWGGREIRRFTAGDGIQDVRATPNGAVWVSYFDEGIFGNYGWNHPGPPCIGRAGCVRFDATGQPDLHYSAEAAGTDRICDAYAMNVAGDDDVWLYFYTQFPIVRFFQGEYRAWKCGVGGAQALAVSDSRVLLLGDYKRPNVARVFRLGFDGIATLEQSALLVDESGVAIDGAQAFGVGKVLYLLRGREVLIVDDW